MVSIVGARLNAHHDGYRLVEFAESPRRFHRRVVPADPAPHVWWNSITEPALVLGSTQRDESVVDVAACDAAGIDVVRRRSGGGAVLLLPGEVTWLDVIVPAGAPGWSEDVHRPMVWLGRQLAASLADVDAAASDVAVHDGPMVSTAHSALLCFDGVGPGEVLLAGHKLIGMSQRRTRGVARLQCCLYHRHDPATLVQLLSATVRPDVGALRPVATVDATTGASVVRRLVERLGRADA